MDLVVADLVHGADLLLQPVVELEAKFASVNLVARGQCAELRHQDLQAGSELQLLRDHVDLGLPLTGQRKTA